MRKKKKKITHPCTPPKREQGRQARRRRFQRRYERMFAESKRFIFFTIIHELEKTLL